MIVKTYILPNAIIMGEYLYQHVWMDNHIFYTTAEKQDPSFAEVTFKTQNRAQIATLETLLADYV